MKHIAVVGAMVLSTASVGQIPAGMKVDLIQYIQAGYSGTKGSLLAAAEKMPESDYDFKPSPMSAARTFGAVIAHAADGMFGVCAVAKGVPNPSGNNEREVQTKAAVVKALTDSIAFCDDVFSSLTEQSATEYVRQGQGEVMRSAVLIGLLAHNAEMFGISTVYLRAKGIVPPGSDR